MKEIYFKKENKILICIFSFITLIIIFILLLIFKNHNKIDNYNKINENNNSESNKLKNNYEAMKDYCSNQISNAGMTYCYEFLSDKLASEREWKMLKLESIKIEDVNTNEIMGNIEESSERIKNWRLVFDDARDKWCDTDYNYYTGSGTPSAIAECKTDLEIMALEQLNELHYDILVGSTFSNSIKDFEPSNKELLLIINTNKTQRDDCGWTDNKNECYKDTDYTLKDLEEFENNFKNLKYQ